VQEYQGKEKERIVSGKDVRSVSESENLADPVILTEEDQDKITREGADVEGIPGKDVPSGPSLVILS
jgi:hypothetical protein